MAASDTVLNPKKHQRWRLPDSIFLKCLFALALSTALTIGVLTYKSVKATDMIASSSVMTLGTEVATQLGERTGPSLRFRKSEDVSAILRKTIDALEGSASGALVLAVMAR